MWSHPGFLIAAEEHAGTSERACYSEDITIVEPRPAHFRLEPPPSFPLLLVKYKRHACVCACVHMCFKTLLKKMIMFSNFVSDCPETQLHGN